MDKFSFLFGFYGLLLGLAVAELLSGFAGLARRFRIRDIDGLIKVLAGYVFLDICSIWIDAFNTLKGADLNLRDLFPPIMVATFLFLAAAMTFPREGDEAADIKQYFHRRKGFVAAMLIGAELSLTITFIPRYQLALLDRPMEFWLWHVPYKLAIVASFIALMIAKSRRANYLALWSMIALIAIPYWHNGAIPRWIHVHFDRTAQGGLQ